MLDESPILCVALDGGLKLGDLPFVLEPQFSPQPTPKKDLVSRIQRSGEDFFGSPAVRLFSQASWGVAEFRAAIKLRTPHFPREPGDPGLSPLQLTRAETRKPWESQQNQPDGPAQSQTRFRQTQGSKAPTPTPPGTEPARVPNLTPLKGTGD